MPLEQIHKNNIRLLILIWGFVHFTVNEYSKCYREYKVVENLICHFTKNFALLLLPQTQTKYLTGIYQEVVVPTWMVPYVLT